VIVHGPENISGFAGLMARGQRQLGLDSISICHSHDGLRFDADYRFGHKGIVGGKSIKSTLFDLLTKADIIHFYFGRSFLGDSLIDARMLKILGRRVFFTFLGCDLRDKSVRLAKNSLDQTPLSMCSQCHPHLCSKNRALALQVARSYSNISFVTTPDLLDEMPSAQYLPLGVDIQKFVDYIPQNYAGEKGDQFRILHAPTDRLKKGTKYIIDAVLSLKAKGLNVELVLTEGLSQQDVFETAKTCHLAIDQLLAGVYGTFGAEAMAMGLTTLARIDDRYRAYYPDELPIIDATPETIESQILKCMNGFYNLKATALRSKAYAQQWHDYSVVAKLMTSFY
jgi:glycosyltransferase involved in cell wall biosynthesis